MPSLVLEEGTFSDTDINSPASYSTTSITWDGAAAAGLFGFSSRAGSVPADAVTVSGGWSTWTLVDVQAIGTVSKHWLYVGTGTKTDEPVTVTFTAGLSSLGRAWVIASILNCDPTTPIGLKSKAANTGASKLNKADQLGIPQIAAERFEDLLASGELPE